LLLITDDRLSLYHDFPENTACEVERQISWTLKTSQAADPPTGAFPPLNIMVAHQNIGEDVHSKSLRHLSDGI
jgi:hypothetical protein